MDEIILVKKEKGYTSRDVVNILSKKFGTKKIGHFGTLDPLAQGLLVIGMGAYTKLGNLLENDTKEYIAEVLVGVATDTYDIEGNIISKNDSFCLEKDNLIKVINSFKKTYLQEVPIYSAVKVNGKKLYEYARNNEKVHLPKKEVTIHEIKLLDLYKKDNNLYFKFRTLVSKGTYIRSLINDISKKINIPLCMSNLERTKQDKFLIEDAFTLNQIKNDEYRFSDINRVLKISKMQVPNKYKKIILNGGLIDKISDDYILFFDNNTKIFLYGPYGDKMKPYLSFETGKN